MLINRCVAGVLAVWVLASPAPLLAEDPFTGTLRLGYTTSDVVGAQTATALAEIFPLDEELQWQVYVPESYNAANPPGVLVFIDPNGYGEMPDEWRSVFDRRNLIWIAMRATSRPSEPKRIWGAILAARAVDKDYAIDLNRLYLGSLDEGALTALNVLLTANEFWGGIYISGSMHWGNRNIPDLDNLRRKHHVFITGTNDRDKQKIRKDYESYKRDGVTNTKLIFDTDFLPRMPRPEQIDEALAFLDSHLSSLR